ncbi:hypothetical protein AB0K52_22000 [Glycomyces sp. NPDC049804]
MTPKKIVEHIEANGLGFDDLLFWYDPPNRASPSRKNKRPPSTTAG